MSKIGLSGSIETFDRASGGPDAPISPILFWTRAFGPVLNACPGRLDEAVDGEIKLIREIPVHVGCRFSFPAHARPQEKVEKGQALRFWVTGRR